MVGGICSLGFRWVVDSGTFWFLGRVDLLGWGWVGFGVVFWCLLLCFLVWVLGVLGSVVWVALLLGFWRRLLDCDWWFARFLV